MAGSPFVVEEETTQQGVGPPGERQARPDPRQSGEANGMYLKSTDNRPDDHCWWCDSENNSGTHQTRDHLFKHCYKWKDQQAAMWARVKEATKQRKQKWGVGDLLADERCSPAVVDFLRSNHTRSTAPPVEEIGTARTKRRRRRGADEAADEVEEQTSSNPRASGIGFHL